MAVVNIHTAKTTLSELLARVAAGEEIIIARGSTLVARIVPYAPVATRRTFGALRGKVHLDNAFFEPTGEAELLEWGT